MRVNFWIICTIILGIASACKKGPNINNIDLTVQLDRFDNKFFAIPQGDTSNNIRELEQEYQEFFRLYNENIIYIGSSSSEEYIANLELFFNNAAVKKAREEVLNVYVHEEEALNKQLTLAFKYYKYYFPNKKTPKLYTYISGFNQSLMLAEGFIGIGLDKYLGSDQSIYKDLGLYRYMVKNMNKENIAPNCMQALAIGEWPYAHKKNDVISKMIYEGTLMYFSRMMLPDVEDHLIFGFTADELKWCKNNERNMWSLLLEEKLLFSTDNFNIIKLTEDSPYTSIFPAESPGKACNWVGYRIVEKYMKSNKSLSLSDLMITEDYADILEKARYNPAR